MSIPRRYLLVWIGQQFPYVARLAVESIAQVDPLADIEVHVLGELDQGEHLTAVARLDAVAVLRIDLTKLFMAMPNGRALRTLFDRIDRSALSAQSNLLRYALLYRLGGVYVDTDVIVRRPLHDLAGGEPFIGLERVWTGDQPRVEGRWNATMIPSTVGWAVAWTLVRCDSRLFGGHLALARRLSPIARFWSIEQANNAVIGAPAESTFIRTALRFALNADPAVRFALGPTLVAQVVREAPGSIAVLPPEVLYPVPPGESYRFFEDRTLELPPSSALIHYVGSNHHALLSTIVEGDPRLASSTSVFWRMAADVERRRSAMRNRARV